MRKAMAIGCALAVVSGCASVGYLTSDANIMPMGSGFVATLSTSLPLGTYTLEHVNGKVLSRAVTDPRRGRTTDGRVPLAMSVSVRAFPEAKECLRVRRPDGKLLAMGASGLTQFRLPALEAAYLQTVEIPELNVAEREYSRNVQLVSQTQAWMASSPAELTSDKTCRIPLPDFNACATDGMARQAARKSCMASVVTCGATGALAESIASQWTDRKQGASALIGALSSGACQAAIDVGRGDRINWLPLIRDLFIDLAAESLLRSLTDDNPSIEAQIVKNAVVGAIHYENCLSDAVTQCQQQRVQQRRFSQQQYQQCNARMAQYLRADYLLGTYRTPADIRNALQARQARLKELSSTSIFHRTPQILQVQPCS